MIVRPDLPVGLLAAQVVHAAGESGALRAPSSGCHAVVLVASPDELRRLESALPGRGIRVRGIYENTPPFEDQIMALGVEPEHPEAGRWLAHLPLLRRCGP